MLDHQAFLDMSGNNPSLPFAEAIIIACGDSGPIYAYNASFEAARLNDLGNQMPFLQNPLISIVARLVDLLPVAQANVIIIRANRAVGVLRPFYPR